MVAQLNCWVGLHDSSQPCSDSIVASSWLMRTRRLGLSQGASGESAPLAVCTLAMLDLRQATCMFSNSPGGIVAVTTAVCAPSCPATLLGTRPHITTDCYCYVLLPSSKARSGHFFSSFAEAAAAVGAGRGANLSAGGRAAM